jgi:hypothetical protein
MADEDGPRFLRAYVPRSAKRGFPRCRDGIEHCYRGGAQAAQLEHDALSMGELCSYRCMIVASNEREDLIRIDKVLEKYNGSERKYNLLQRRSVGVDSDFFPHKKRNGSESENEPPGQSALKPLLV